MNGRRTLLLASMLAGAAARAKAQSFPARPIRLVVPFPPGGGVDVFARAVAPALQARLGQTVVIENIGGASSRLGTQAVLRAAPDGHTLLVTNDTLAAVEALPPRGATPLLPGLVPITLAIDAPNLLVTHPRSGIADIESYAARLKARPGSLNVGVPGWGTSHHLTSELIAQAIGARPEHISYRGGGPLLADLLAGTVDAALVTLGAAAEQIRDGRLVGLAVTSTTRAPSAPNVPTIAETIAPDFEQVTWMGVLAPAETPRAVRDALHAATIAALEDPAVRERLAGVGYGVVGAPAERFAQVLSGTAARFAAVVAAAGITAADA
jgi:tripartite-type tricarboxylate transporter receptor subunit TctC